MKTIVKESPLHGRGVFALEEIQEGEIIEFCELIILDEENSNAIGKTFLCNYHFSWEESTAIALGNGSLYNHSTKPNAKYYQDYFNEKIIFMAIKPIKKGEEILVNYNGDPESQEKVWFEKEEY